MWQDPCLPGHREAPDTLCPELWRAQEYLRLGLWYNDMGTASPAHQHCGGAWLQVDPVQRGRFEEGVCSVRDPSLELEHCFPNGTA